MSKIYVFAIGGTGSRVLRSLTMLLAAGCNCKADTIVPIIIDPDAAGGNVNQTVELMDNYERIRNQIGVDNDNNHESFFKTKISRLTDNYHLRLMSTQNKLFKEYISLSEMSRANQALARVLFTDKNLNASIEVGFKGNPHVGSVVLNQFENSIDFKNFANAFADGDKIFIVSSIFGGTGASGFPLLVKLLRTSTNIANHALVNISHIGAITVLPYFKVEQNADSQIDSGTFVSKSKSALAYYHRTMSGGCNVDNMYYIADDTKSSIYENNEGGVRQQNNAHFVELAAALAIIDFANSDKPTRTIYKEFGITSDIDRIKFRDLGPQTSALLMKPLTQFLLFSKYLLECNDLTQPWARDRNLDQAFFSSVFVNNLSDYFAKFKTWLNELSKQTRAFIPLRVHNIDPDTVFDIVEGYTPIKKLLRPDNFTLYNNTLNGMDFVVNRTHVAGTKEQMFVELFYKTTKKLVEIKYNLGGNKV